MEIIKDDNRAPYGTACTECNDLLISPKRSWHTGGARSLSFLGLRKLRSRLVGECDRQCSRTGTVGAAIILKFILSFRYSTGCRQTGCAPACYQGTAPCQSPHSLTASDLT